jgi:hypothetical protein
MSAHPPLPTGASNEAVFWRWVVNCIVAIQRGNVPGLLSLVNSRPRRPTGAGYEAQLAQWCYDQILRLNPKETRGVYVSKTTRGIIHRAR